MKRLFLTLTFTLLFIPFGISQDLPSYVPTDGLLAYYPLDGNGQDKTDYQNHMNMIGQVTYVADREGKIGKAVNFTNSLSGYFELPVSSWSHLNALPNGSLSFWIKLDQKFVSNHYFGFGNSFMVKQKHGQGQDFFIGLSDDTTNVMVYLSGVFPQSSSNYIVGNSSLALDTWYNIVVTWNGSYQKLYVNGNLDGELNVGYDGIPDRTDIDFFSIGSATYGTNTSISESDAGAYGSMDNIAFWNRELSEQEIQNLYNSSTGDIILNGVVSAENNQIKNVADPTEAQDAVTLGLLLEKISSLQDQIDALQSTSGSGTVTDQDGNSYPYLTYGDQVWIVKNAKMVTYRDGTPIPQVTDATEWANLTTGAWCYYDNDPSKGKLYNWYAVAGIHDNDENTPNKELAPEGWHVPTDAEWSELENYLIANGYNYDGTTTGNKIAKAMSSTTGWNGSTIEGTPGNNQFYNNSSGFNAFAVGSRYDNNSSFYNKNIEVAYWTNTEFEANFAMDRSLNFDIFSLRGHHNYKISGFSVRFVRD